MSQKETYPNLGKSQIKLSNKWVKLRIIEKGIKLI